MTIKLSKKDTFLHQKILRAIHLIKPMERINQIQLQKIRMRQIAIRVVLLTLLGQLIQILAIDLVIPQIPQIHQIKQMDQEGC